MAEIIRAALIAQYWARSLAVTGLAGVAALVASGDARLCRFIRARNDGSRIRTGAYALHHLAMFTIGLLFHFQVQVGAPMLRLLDRATGRRSV